MNFKVRRRLTYASIACMFFFNGIEYAVIFPTIWAYLQHLGVQDTDLLGVTIAGFSVASTLIEPITGKWYDKSHNAKLIVLIMNIFEIIGSGMYFIGFSPWFIVSSRFVCGLGASAATAVLSDISNSTKVDERTSIMANIQACRQIGLLIGPALNLLLQQCNFKIGKYTITKLNAPGLFMAVIGVIQEILFLTLYHNLVTLSNNEQLTESLRHSCYGGEPKETRRTINYGSIVENSQTISSVHSDLDFGSASSHASAGAALPNDNIVVIHEAAVPDCQESVTHVCQHLGLKRTISASHIQDSNEMIENAEDFMCSVCSCSEKVDNTSSPNSTSPELSGQTSSTDATGSSNLNSQNIDSYETSVKGLRRNVTLSWSHHIEPYKNEFLRTEVVVLLSLSFVSLFAQTALETIATPLSQKYFNFGEFENSLFFLAAGVEILITVLLIKLLSRKLEDRILIMIGSILMIFSLIWYITFVPRFAPGDWGNLPYFIIGVAANLFGISLLVVCCISLYSKTISKENQGIGQGIRRVLLNIGMILGPLWGGATTTSPYLLFSVPLAVTSLFTILLCISFSDLESSFRGTSIMQRTQRGYSNSWAINATENESTSLLQS